MSKKKKKIIVGAIIIAIVLIFLGAVVGNYVQQNKYEVKEKLKNFIDRL